MMLKQLDGSGAGGRASASYRTIEPEFRTIIAYFRASEDVVEARDLQSVVGTPLRVTLDGLGTMSEDGCDCCWC